MKKLFCSFSGGETSALMTKLLLTRWRDRFSDAVVVFANTGEENEATLDFVRWCDRAWKLNVVWVEAVVNPEKGEGTTCRVVSFETASRNGEPYEAVIKKYGIPNAKWSHCTRELKQAPMYSYIRSLGWENGSYSVAVGIRADEANRRTNNPAIIYPLIDWEPLTKPDVNSFWQAQPYRLQLSGYQGNCKTCWKKTNRKLLTIMDESPNAFDFFERMEAENAHVGPEFNKTVAPGYKRVFFRRNLSTKDLRKMHAAGGWDRAENDAVVCSGKTVSLDDTDGCVESCEVDWSSAPNDQT